MVKETRAKLICDRCRKGHLKCDNQQPDCGRCQAAGKRCHRSNDIKFRKRLNTTNFSESVRARAGSFTSVRPQSHNRHTWVNTNDAPLRFVDVTHEVANDTPKPADDDSVASDSNTMVTPDALKEASNAFRSSPGAAGAAGAAIALPPGPAAFSPLSLAPGSVGTQASGAWDFTLENFAPSPALNDVGIEHPMIFGNELAQTSTTFHPALPTTSQRLHHSTATATAAKSLDLKEAKLMRHYAENMAPWLDISNRDRYFEMAIPSQAVQRPCLLNAILAISARHLSRISDYDPSAYEGYTRRCLSLYKPPMSEQEGDELLALTGILRLFEGLEVSLATFDPTSPLAGFEDMAWSRSAHYSNSEVSQLLIRSGLRQDIHTSFIRQEAVSSLINSLVVDRTLGLADDFTWADRMLVHLGEILKFCFGASDSSPLKWNQLMDYQQQWWENRPFSFAPIYYKDPEPGTLFPDIWLSSDCHVAALQHYHLGMIMLKTYNPRIPRLGPSRKEWLSAVEKETKFHISQVCGIALSNPRIVPAILTACHAVATCGESFKEKWEQEQLLEILTKARRKYGWLTSTLQSQLKDAWGYDSTV